MAETTELIEVLVTDKNGRVSKRRKKPENIKPGDVIVGAEKAAEVTEAVKAEPKAKAAPKAVKKPAAKKPVVKKTTKPVAKKPAPEPVRFQLPPEPEPTPPTRDEIIAASKLGRKVLRAVLQHVPNDRLIDYEVSPHSVELTVCNLFGYESRIAIDFIYNIEVDGDTARLDFNETPMFYSTHRSDLETIYPAPSNTRKVAPLARGWKQLASGV